MKFSRCCCLFQSYELDMEGVVLEGWLLKSPPERKVIKSKWRHRWFVLRAGDLPGQFLLDYFSDKTCKKQRGRIDLDQCEQVTIDSAVQCDSRKARKEFIFDLRTPNRIYYLVAETEAEMNQWVESICSVCGLKMHVDEDYFVSPTASSASGPIQAGPTSQMKSYSNPYIPISECHTGKPLTNGELLEEIVPLSASVLNSSAASNQTLRSSQNHPTVGMTSQNSSVANVQNAGTITRKSNSVSSPQSNSNSNNKQSASSNQRSSIASGLLFDIEAELFHNMPKEPPPPLPLSERNSVAEEFYDHPKPLKQHSRSESVDNADGRNSVQSIRAPSCDVFSTLPPRVNWNTYPDDAFLPTSSSTVPRRKASSADSEEPSIYDIVPSFHGSVKENKLKKKNVHSLMTHFENMALVESPKLQKKENSDIMEHKENDPPPSLIPPRPPKPSKLRELHAYENFEPIYLNSIDDLQSSDVSSPSKSTSSKPNSPLNTEGDVADSFIPPPKSTSISMDEVYDFPKFRNEDNINAPVPPPSQNMTGRNRSHAYDNAPPGLFNSKDLIFNYESRPGLITTEIYTHADRVKSEDLATPPSPSALGVYCNVPSSPTLVASLKNDLPPAVNRDLKPKRVVSNDDEESINFLTLQPPPICRSKLKTGKRSFTNPRAAPSPTPANGMPPVPNRFRQPQELLTKSDDEISNSSGSRRNSSNDDQVKLFFAGPLKKDEIQYLDLDLDSEPSPSPKTPDRMSSTVYKKVDFVKTKALSDVRVNVFENYRKSQ